MMKIVAALALTVIVLPGSVRPAAAATAAACYRAAAQCTAKCKTYDYACFAGCDVILDLCLDGYGNTAPNTGTINPGSGSGTEPVKSRFPGKVGPVEGVITR